MKATDPIEWISQFFPKGPTNRQISEWGNIWWRVVVSSLPPRHEQFEYMRSIGSGLVESVLLHQPLRSHRHLCFFFPEQMLSTQEEQLFVPMLQSHPDVVNEPFTIIDICTKSALLIGNFIKEDIRILHIPQGGYLLPEVQEAHSKRQIHNRHRI
jgi:hypothetical protein